MTDLAAINAVYAQLGAAFDANVSPSLVNDRELGWTAHEFDAIVRDSGIRCPDCGGHLRVDATEVTQMQSPVPRYIAGRWHCDAAPTGRTA